MRNKALLCLVLVAAPEAMAQESPWRFGLRAEAEARYDDNIISLSKSEKRQLEHPSDPNSEDLFRIESAEDVILVPQMALSLSRSPREGRQTGLRLTLRAHDYLRNSVKDYQEYLLSVRQDLNRSRRHSASVTLGGSTIPSYYLRELIDDDLSTPGNTVRSSADFRMNRGYVEYSQEVIHRALRVTAEYARERRDYNGDFDERDSSSDLVSADLSIYPLRRILFRARPYYAHERRRARGDTPTTAIVDDETDFDADLIGVDLRWVWGGGQGRRQILRPYYQIEQRDFTTRNSASTGHFGRQDEIRKYGMSYDKDLGPRWRVSLSGYHRDNEVSFPGSSATTFRRNVVGAALVYSFEKSLDSAEPEAAGPKTEG